MTVTDPCYQNKCDYHSFTETQKIFSTAAADVIAVESPMLSQATGGDSSPTMLHHTDYTQSNSDSGDGLTVESSSDGGNESANLHVATDSPQHIMLYPQTPSTVSGLAEMHNNT